LRIKRPKSFAAAWGYVIETPLWELTSFFMEEHGAMGVSGSAGGHWPGQKGWEPLHIVYRFAASCMTSSKMRKHEVFLVSCQLQGR